MGTTIELPTPLFRKLRKLADKRGVTSRRLIEEAVRAYVARAERTRFVLKEASFRGDGLVDGLDWSNWDVFRERGSRR